MRALALLLAFACAAQGAVPIRFRTERAGFVALNLYRPDGTLARQLLTGAPRAAGNHEAAWDATGLPPGDYAWRAVFHEGFALKLRGIVGDFGGDRGAPSAAAADTTQIYLGWSAATAAADAVVACPKTWRTPTARPVAAGKNESDSCPCARRHRPALGRGRRQRAGPRERLEHRHCRRSAGARVFSHRPPNKARTWSSSASVTATASS